MSFDAWFERRAKAKGFYELRPTPVLRGKAADRFYRSVNPGEISPQQKKFLQACARRILQERWKFREVVLMGYAQWGREWMDRLKVAKSNKERSRILDEVYEIGYEDGYRKKE